MKVLDRRMAQTLYEQQTGKFLQISRSKAYELINSNFKEHERKWENNNER